MNFAGVSKNFGGLNKRKNFVDFVCYHYGYFPNIGKRRWNWCHAQFFICTYNLPNNYLPFSSKNLTCASRVKGVRKDTEYVVETSKCKWILLLYWQAICLTLFPTGRSHWTYSFLRELAQKLLLFCKIDKGGISLRKFLFAEFCQFWKHNFTVHRM
jgi:hypothetical protein